MDYDDNDFASRNPQLVGEGSVEFPPVLRPYALSKYDFDDSLQEHLRFDNLVESGVFLGVESHEDNQWIEDFSQGSSRIEFASSAAASCPISRHSNVWSEATSLESVEMLLKSVGQEVTIPGQTIAEESEACDRLGSSTNQIDQVLERHDNIISSAKDSTDFGPTLPPGKMNSSSRLNEDSAGIVQVEDTLHAFEGAASGLDNSRNFDKKDVVESCSPVAEGSQLKDGNLDDANQREGECDEALDSRILDNSSSSQMHSYNLVTSVLPTDIIIQDSNSELAAHQANHYSEADKFGMEKDQDEDGKSHSLSIESQIDHQNMNEDIDSGVYNREEPPVVAHEKESVEEINKVGTSLLDMDPSSSLTVKGNSDPETLKGCSANVCPPIPAQDNKPEFIGPTKDAHSGYHFKENIYESSPVALEGDCHVEVYAGETTNYNSGVGANIEMQTHSYVKINDKMCRMSEGTEYSKECSKQMDSMVSVSKSEASLLSTEDSKYFEVQSERNTDSVMMETSIYNVVSSSSELETQMNLKLEGIPGTLGVSGDDSNGEGEGSSSLLAKSKKCEENLVHVHDDDINREQGYSRVDEVAVGEAQFTYTAGNILTSDDSMKNTECIPNNTLDGCLMSKENSASSLEAVNPKDDGKSISATEGPALNDKRGEVASKISVEAVLILNEGSQVVSVLGPVLKSGNEAHHSTAGYRNNEELDQSQIAAKDVEDVLIEQETHHVFCNSTVKEDSVAVGALKSCDEAAKVICEETLSDVVDKPTCGSPTAISCVESRIRGRDGGDTGHLEQNVILTNVSGDSKEVCFVSQEQMDFSFDVRSLTDKGDTAKGCHQLTFTEASKLTPIVERASSVSDFGHSSPMKVQEISHVSPQSNNVEIKIGGSRGTHERKPRRTSGKATEKESTKRGNHVKLSTPMRQLQEVDKSSAVSPDPSLACQLVQSEGMEHTGHLEHRRKNTPNVLTTPISSLPDLNTSAALIAVLQPSFTGSQQVQLRAQIFVYGSLIQGIAPEEACMISAFGDGGRGMWEKAWRVFLQRLQDQKCNSSNPETPLQQLSGTRSPDHANKQGFIQGNNISSPAGRASSKSTPSPVLNSTMPLSSPLWSITTPGDAVHSRGIPRSPTMAHNQMPSPLHPYMTPSIRSFTGHSWVPQSPFAGPWVPSPQVSPFSSNLRFPPLSITEPVKSNPVRESSGTHASLKHVVATPIFQIEGVYPGTSMTPDVTKATLSPVQDSANPKSRKRKKSSASEDPSLVYLPPQAGTYLGAAFAAPSQLSSSVVTMNTPMSKTIKGKFVPVAASTPSHDQPKINNIDVEQSHVLSEETLNNVKEAKLQAENAATLAATALNHSQVVWDELDKQKNSGMIAEREAMLASAAVAIAAAASVAKAAAAAAKVSAAAALQAKLMAEEAMFPGGEGGSSQINIKSLSNAVSILGDATPASILKGQDGMDSSGSILIAAREAARSRVEAASAASRRAENLDAIVKAAELAAEAVTQAGKVVAMGNYLPLIELAEAGPMGYWKIPSDPALKSNNSKRGQLSIQSIQHTPQILTKHVEDVSIEQRGALTAGSKKAPTPRELSRFSVEDYMKSIDGSSGEGDEKRQNGSKASVIAETVAVLTESNIESRNSSIAVQEQEKTVGIFSGETIKVGSLVEVFKDVNSSKAAWCLASVLSLKGGEAYVCYTEILSGEGKLKEWVSLNAEGDNAPRIRFPHPTTTIQFEGSKKRCRETMISYNWSVGDKVDACMDNCWCEGVVTEKNKKDETTLTVHFPAQGKTSIVRAWKLRPSLLWKEGQWIEWSNLREDNLVSHEGDTPREKRRKIGSPAVVSKGKETVSADINVVEPAVTDGTLLLDLCANEKIFNIGKNTKDESSKLEPLRTVRSGLQKEGSRNFFGIPKPVKKRKLMEVSKHYSTDKNTNKTSVGNNQVKLAKVPIPQESGSRGWRNTKIDFRETRPAGSKLRAFKTGKTLSVPSSQDGVVMDRRTNLKGSSSLSDNAPGKQRQAEFGSFSKNEGLADGPIVFSSLPVPPNVSSKKVSWSNSKHERVNKGKLPPCTGKLAKILEDKVHNSDAGKSVPDGGPRRSNRRIQPTSRMLEGLQSSLSTSNSKPQNKNAYYVNL